MTRSKIRVLIVDDAVVIRRLLVEALSGDPDLEVAGWASNGKLALAQIPKVNPDCVTLDLEMPEMDGLETLVAIRKIYPRLPVIMFSTLTEHGAVKTLEALARGASDYVTKPANVGNVLQTITKLREDLLPRIKAMVTHELLTVSEPGPRTAMRAPTLQLDPSRPAPTSPGKTGLWQCKVICIASSTGGPNAVSSIVSQLPENLPVPILLTQHMPPVFTAVFAARLKAGSKLNAAEGSEGMKVEPGSLYVAPGGKHLTVEQVSGSAVIRITDDPPENSCRPAADVMFRSAVKVYGKHVLGVVLTGMGQDGLRGCRAVSEAGGCVIVQDEASSVVWGMPGAVAKEGLAEQVLPMSQIASAVLSICNSNTRVRLP